MKKLFLTLIFISTVFTADDLLSIYNEALERDPEFNSKKADLKISKEFRNQSISALLPRLNLSASTNWNEYYQERILQNDYNTFTYNLNFNQPLFRLDSWFNSRQAQKNYRAAEAQFAYQQQNLMIRVTRAYFNVLSARSLFKTRGANERTLENQFEEINDKFEAGAASRIELAEAKAALNRAISDRVLAEGNVDIAFEELNAIVGREVKLISPLKDDFKSVVNLEGVSDEVEKGIENNFLISEAESRLEAAESKTRSRTSNFLPKIDLNANANRRTSKQYTFDGVDSDLDLPFFIPEETENRSFSVQFSMPLFTSGLNSSQRRQAMLEEVRTEEQLLLIQRNVTQRIRSLYTSLKTGQLNIESLEASYESSEDALEATRLGYELKARNLVDLLRAERNFFDAQNRLSQAKYDFIIRSLEFKQATGSLKPQDIIDVNNFLD
jgi:outer membrane protein